MANYRYNRHGLLIDWIKEQKDLCERYQPSKRAVQRGAIFYCRLGENVGHELSKSRPVLVISDSSRNISGNNVTVIPLLSAYHYLKNEQDKRTYQQDKNYVFDPKAYKIRPTQYLLRKIDFPGLSNDSLVTCENIRTVSKGRLDLKSIELIDENTMEHIEKRVLETLDMRDYKKES